MKIKLLFFGITTDLTGSSSIEIDVTNNCSVEKLKSILVKKYPNLKHINSYAIAVNEAYANNEYLLTKNDIVAIIPPVSGG